MLNKASLITVGSCAALGLTVVPAQAGPTSVQTSEPSVTINGENNNVSQTTYQYILNNPGRGVIKRNEPDAPQGRNHQVIPETGEKGKKEWGMSQGIQHGRSRQR